MGLLSAPARRTPTTPDRPERPARPGPIRLAATCAVCMGLWLPLLGHGQSATPGATVELEELVVVGSAPTAGAVARERLAAMPAGTAFLAVDDLQGQANLTVSDALTTAPGVIVQDFFGANDQPRIQMRGSGLQQNPVERGVLFLQDGLPLNRADGAYVVGLADPRQAEYIEVNRGYAANRLGATVLGGALNFVSPTGSSQPGLRLDAEGGSFGHVNVSGRGGFSTGTMDGFLIATHTRRDGFRDINDSERTGVTANAGFVLNDAVKTRFFAGFTDLGFDVAGPLPAAVLDDDPERNHPGPTVIPGMPPTVLQPGPNVLRDRPQREATQLRIGNRTTAELGAHVLDAAVGYVHSDDEFRFPIPGGIRATDGGDLTVVGRYAWRPDDAAVLPRFEATVQFATGSADRRNYVNDRGTRGALFGDSELDATTLALHAGAHLPLGGGFTLSPALAWSHATRENTDEFTAPARPTIAFSPLNPAQRVPDGAVPAVSTSYDRSYSGVTPSLALTWQPGDAHLLFAALSRSFEPPTHDDLLATVNGTPNSSPGRPNPGNPALVADVFRTPGLDEQTATTVEFGWRGGFERLVVDAVTYYAWVDDELLNLRDVTGASLGAINADDTRHFGVELGVYAELGDALSTRISYTFQDFHFEDDPLRSNNELAGAPPHNLRADVDWTPLAALYLGTTVDWRPADTPVDNLNTLYNDGFVTVDLRGRYELNPSLALFAEVRNVFDETYAASTLIVDQGRADQAAFIPGDGRAGYVGVTLRF